MKTPSLILFLVFSWCCVFSQTPKTLKDSLLGVYTFQELEEMNLREFGNALRKLRGQDTIALRKPKPVKTHDGYGVKIVEAIPGASSEALITSLYTEIEKNKEDYRQEVFPNSPVDITNEFNLGFYENELERAIRYDNYRDVVYYEEGGDDFVIKTFTNNTKRTYYCDESGVLRLIEIEAGFNVNEGKQRVIYGRNDAYYRTRYYLINDSLSYVERKIFWIDYGDDTSVSFNELPDSLINAYSSRRYFYKGNCFKAMSKKSVVRVDEWEEDLDKLSYKTSESGDLKNNHQTLKLKNLLLEYDEYKNNKRDYLKPIPASFIQEPYIIKGSWEK